MSDRSKFILLILAVTLIGAFFRLSGILAQPPLPDEIHMAYTAQSYVEQGHFIPTMPHHPNLRNLLVFLSDSLFGVNGLSLRLFSLIFGIASIPLLGLFLHRSTGSMTASLLGAFFLAVDPLSITFSRQAIQEVYVPFFSLLGIYLVLLGRDSIGRNREAGTKALILLPLAGIAFGFGLASKYNAAFVLSVGLVLIAWSAARAGRIDLAVFALFCLTLLPGTVFLLTDAPWFGRGYNLSDWIFMRKAMFARMSYKFIPPITETNPDRAAWEWFLNPFLGYSGFTILKGKNILTAAMANPLVWLLVLPSSLFLAAKTATRKRSALLQALFWCSYLPFAVTTERPIFFLSAVAVAPFAFGIVGLALAELLSSDRKRLLYGYLAAVFTLSILLFPLCRGKALEHKYTEILTERFSPHR